MDAAGIEQAVLQMATLRGVDKSICPSEVARTLFPADWRKHMDEIRAAAFKLQTEHKVQITQKGEPVTEAGLKGPIRIKVNT